MRKNRRWDFHFTYLVYFWLCNDYQITFGLIKEKQYKYEI